MNDRTLCSFLNMFVDFFLGAVLLFNGAAMDTREMFVCIAFLVLGMMSCFGSLLLKVLGDFFIPSVIQTAVFLLTGFESGSMAPLFFIPFEAVCIFILDRGRIRKWVVVAGSALGTYVLFGTNLSSFMVSASSLYVRELVFSCVLSTVFTAVMLNFHLGRNEKAMKQMMKEAKYLSLQTDELADQNCRDKLTGLPNRRYYDLMLPKLTGSNEELGTPLSLIVIDIDFFKKINDTYGHATGDSVLSALGDLISTSIRPNDIACRYGGEEFVVLMKADGRAAAERAEILRRKAEMLDIHGVRITISCGVAQYERGADLFSLADSELYRAKELGRNRVCARDGSEEI